MFCPSCGNKMNGNESFCPNCGTNIDLLKGAEIIKKYY